MRQPTEWIPDILLVDGEMLVPGHHSYRRKKSECRGKIPPAPPKGEIIKSLRVHPLSAAAVLRLEKAARRSGHPALRWGQFTIAERSLGLVVGPGEMQEFARAGATLSVRQRVPSRSAGCCSAAGRSPRPAGHSSRP